MRLLSDQHKPRYYEAILFLLDLLFLTVLLSRDVIETLWSLLVALLLLYGVVMTGIGLGVLSGLL